MDCKRGYMLIEYIALADEDDKSLLRGLLGRNI